MNLRDKVLKMNKFGLSCAAISRKVGCADDIIQNIRAGHIVEPRGEVKYQIEELFKKLDTAGLIDGH